MGTFSTLERCVVFLSFFFFYFIKNMFYSSNPSPIFNNILNNFKDTIFGIRELELHSSLIFCLLCIFRKLIRFSDPQLCQSNVVCGLLIVLVQMGKLDEFSLSSSPPHSIPGAGTSSLWGMHITLLSTLTPEICNLK